MVWHNCNYHCFCYLPPLINNNNNNSQCNTNIFEYLNIRHRILDIRIRILNFLVTNIFDIRIQSGWGQQIYSIFVFCQQSGYEYIRYLYSVKSFINMFLFIARQQKSLGTCINMHQKLFKIYFIKKLVFYIFNICIRPIF